MDMYQRCKLKTEFEYSQKKFHLLFITDFLVSLDFLNFKNNEWNIVLKFSDPIQ